MEPNYKLKAIEFAWDVMSQAHLENEVYDTMALSHIRDAAEFLCSEGHLENTGKGTGRKQFYQVPKKPTKSKQKHFEMSKETQEFRIKTWGLDLKDYIWENNTYLHKSVAKGK